MCIFFFLSQRKEARERIKHLYYQCELLSDLSEPPSVKGGWMRAVGASEGMFGGELRRVYEREAGRWQKKERERGRGLKKKLKVRLCGGV